MIKITQTKGPILGLDNNSVYLLRLLTAAHGIDVKIAWLYCPDSGGWSRHGSAQCSRSVVRALLTYFTVNQYYIYYLHRSCHAMHHSL